MKTGRIDVERLVSLPVRYGIVVSPDGERVAYHSTTEGNPELFVLELRTGRVQQVSRGELPRGATVEPVWSHDGSSLYVSRDCEGDEQFSVYRLDLADQSFTPVVTGPGQYVPVELSPDGTRLSLAVVTPQNQLALHVVSLSDGTQKKLTDFVHPVRGGYWHPSGDWLVCVANDTDDLENADLWCVSPDRGDAEVMFSSAPGALDGCGRFSRDGRFLAVTSNATGVWRPGVLDTKTRRVTWYGEGLFNEAALGFTHDGEWLITVLDRDGVANPVLHRLEDEESRSLDVPAGVTSSCQSVLGGEKLLIAHEDATHPVRLLLYDLSDDRWSEILPADFGGIQPEALAKAEHCTFTTDEGFTVGAIVYRPRESDGGHGEGRPVVIDVHGGPTMHAMVRFNPFAQALADHGYVVVQPNYRGSTGYGAAFERANRGDLGGGDARDVIAAAAFARSLPGVDGRRVAVRGVSYGGYLTHMALFRSPEAWGAAIVLAGMTDWKELYRRSSGPGKSRIRQLLGDPNSNAGLLEERSPITQVCEPLVPLLMIHGANDPRCPVDQARRMREALRSHGWMEGLDGHFEYVELDGQGHGSTVTEDRIRVWNLQLDFLRRRLAR